MPISSILGLLGGGLNVWGNIMTNQTNADIARMTNETNLAINQQQMQHADEAAAMADQRTRALFADLYSPQARVQQLKEAGLSVGLMYGQGGMGGSGSAGAQANTPGMAGAVTGAPMQNIFGIELMSMLANMAKTNAETRNIEAKTEETRANIPILEQTKELVTEQTEQTRQQTQLIKQQINSQIESQILIREQQKDTKAAAELKQAQKTLTETQNNLAKIDLIYKDNLNYWECKKAEEEFNKLLQETRKLEIDADNEEAIINATLMEMTARTFQAMTAGTLNEKEAEFINEQIRQAKRANDAEEYLNNLLQTTDEEGQGGGKRQGLKSAARFLLELYRTYKSGRND